MFQLPISLVFFITPHAQHERGKLIGVGVHILYIYVYGQKKNCTLAIDSPFQIFAVGLLIEFIDKLYHCFLFAFSRNAFLVE